MNNHILSSGGDCEYIVLFSGGLASFVACTEVVKKIPQNQVKIWFFDTLIEDQDTYRFISQSENIFAHQIERFMDGRNMWQVFRDERFIGNSQKCVCTRVLKKEVLHKVLKEQYPEKNVVLCFGLESFEIERITKVEMRWRETGYSVHFPLLDTPDYKNRAEYESLLAASGLSRPRLYDLGFKHNNCGGGCVRAGISQWVKLFRFFPERYLWHEEQEELTRMFLNKNVSILKDRKGNYTKSLTLKELRARIEGGKNGYC